MASGCVAVVPADSGSEDYAVDGVNARLVSTKDEAGAVAVLAELARDAALRARLRARALETVEGYALRAASATTLRVLCAALDDPDSDPDEARAAYAAELGRLLDGFLRPDARAVTPRG